VAGESQTVGDYVNVEITFTPSHDLSNSSIFELESLKWNPGTGNTSKALSFWVDTNLFGTLDRNGARTYNIGCYNEDHPELDC
jgi:hypothetical protein